MGGRRRVVMRPAGADRNAFAVLGRFQRRARRQGWTADEVRVVAAEATSGDYWHLLATIAGHVVELSTAEVKDNEAVTGQGPAGPRS